MVSPNVTDVRNRRKKILGEYSSSPSGELGNEVVSQLMTDLKNKGPSAGTQAQINQNNEALAAYSRNLKANTAANIAKGGAIGQGTQSNAGQQVGLDILRNLGENQRKNTMLVSNERQNLLSQAQNVASQNRGQSIQEAAMELGEDRAERQFESTQNLEKERMENQKQQFQTTEDRLNRAQDFNQNQTNLNMVERMAQDNPVLSRKLQNHILQGGSGPIGGYTPEEKNEIKQLMDEKQARGEKLEAAELRVLEEITKEDGMLDRMFSPDGKLPGERTFSDNLSQRVESGEFKNMTGSQISNVKGEVRDYNPNQVADLLSNSEAISQLQNKGVISKTVINEKDLKGKAPIGENVFKKRYPNLKPGDLVIIKGKDGKDKLIEFDRYTSDRKNNLTTGFNTRRNGALLGKDLSEGDTDIWSSGWSDVD